MEEKEIKKKVSILEAKGYLFAKRPNLALAAYQRADVDIDDSIRKDFNDCGDKCFQKGFYLLAAEAYTISENADGLIRAGNQLLEEDPGSKGAIAAYQKAVHLQYQKTS